MKDTTLVRYGKCRIVCCSDLIVRSLSCNNEPAQQQLSFHLVHRFSLKVPQIQHVEDGDGSASARPTEKSSETG